MPILEPVSLKYLYAKFEKNRSSSCFVIDEDKTNTHYSICITMFRNFAMYDEFVSSFYLVCMCWCVRLSNKKLVVFWILKISVREHLLL